MQRRPRAYLCPRAAADVLAGLFGLGGGIVIVPALFFLYLQQGFPAELCMHLAAGSSARDRGLHLGERGRQEQASVANSR